MSGSSKTEETSAQKTDPWAPQAGALASAFANAGNAYGTASHATAPTDFVAGMTPEQLATFRSAIGYANSNTAPGTASAVGSALAGAGTNAATGALSGLGSFDPTQLNNTSSLIDAANQYMSGQNIDAQVNNAMLNARQTARDVTLPGIEQNAQMTGNTNSSRTGIAEGLVERGLAQQATDLGGSLRSQAFRDGLTLASSNANANNASRLGALTSAAGLGTNAATAGVNAGSAGIANQGALFDMANAGGSGLQSSNQLGLDNLLKRYQSGVSSPYDALNGLMGIIGTNNWGSSGTGSKTTAKTPSMWEIVGGLLDAGGKAKTLFSDRRIKEDIKVVGKLDNGLPVYTFRYKGFDQLHMGLMAQDVELVKPDAVVEINGIKAVNYEMASA
jgi:hypothetical protein